MVDRRGQRLSGSEQARWLRPRLGVAAGRRIRQPWLDAGGCAVVERVVQGLIPLEVDLALGEPLIEDLAGHVFGPRAHWAAAQTATPSRPTHTSDQNTIIVQPQPVM